MPDLGDLLALLGGGGAAPAGGAPAVPTPTYSSGLTGASNVPASDAVSQTVAPSTSVSGFGLPSSSPQVLATLRKTPQAAATVGTAAGATPGSGFLSGLSGLSQIKAGPGDQGAAFLNAFGTGLKAQQDQQSAQAKMVQDRADKLFSQNLQTQTAALAQRAADRADKTDARAAAKDAESSEAGGVQARMKTAHLLGIEPDSDDYKSYVATGELSKDKDENTAKNAYYKGAALNQQRNALGLTADDKVKASNFGQGGMDAATRAAAQAKLDAFSQKLEAADANSQTPAKKKSGGSAKASDGNNGGVDAIVGGGTPGAPAGGEESDDEDAPAAAGPTAAPGKPTTPGGQPVRVIPTPSAPGAAPASGLNPAATPPVAAPAPAPAASAAPIMAKNPQTGEVRQFDPSTGTWAPVQVPIQQDAPPPQ